MSVKKRNEKNTEEYINNIIQEFIKKYIIKIEDKKQFIKCTPVFNKFSSLYNNDNNTLIKYKFFLEKLITHLGVDCYQKTYGRKKIL